MSGFPHDCEGAACFCVVAMDSSDLQEEMNPEFQMALFANKTLCDPPSYATGDLFEPLADGLVANAPTDFSNDFYDVSCHSPTESTRQPTPMSVDPSYGARTPVHAPQPLRQDFAPSQDFAFSACDDKNLVLGLADEKPGIPSPLATMSEAGIADLANDHFQALIKTLDPAQVRFQSLVLVSSRIGLSPCPVSPVFGTSCGVI